MTSPGPEGPAAAPTTTATQGTALLRDDCTYDELADWLQTADVRLTARGSRLRYDAPAGTACLPLEAALRRHRSALLAALERPPAPERSPATEEQRGMAGNHARSPEPAAWNIPVRLRLRGSLDPVALRTALSLLTRRHAALRCRFVQDLPQLGHQAANGEGTLQQEILPPRPVHLPATDLRMLPTAERSRRLDDLCADAAHPPFDLATDVLPRFRLLRAGDWEWTLLIVLHHICCDGWAVSLLLNELAALYRRALGDPAVSPLPPPTMQCTDYAHEQLTRQAGPEERRRRLQYWARQLDSCPAVSGLPADRPRPVKLSGAGSSARVTLPTGVMDGIAAYARRHGTTPFAVTVAALAVELTARTGRTDVVLNTSYANRPHHALEGLVTVTARTILLRIMVRAEDSFPDLCRQVTATLLDGVDHLLPLAELRAGLQREHGIALPVVNPLGMTYQNSLDLTLDLPDLEVEMIDQETTTTRRECSFGLIPLPDGSGQVYSEFSTDLFDAATVADWLAAYAVRLRSLTA